MIIAITAQPASDHAGGGSSRAPIAAIVATQRVPIAAGHMNATEVERFLWHDGRPPSGREDHPVVLVTWDDAQMLAVEMLSARGTGDAEALGVHPRRVADVLG